MSKSVMDLGGRVRRSAKAVADRRKTLLIYSPDGNFCDSLAMFFGDRYDVLTTDDMVEMESIAGEHRANLVLVDAGPSRRFLERLEKIRARDPRVPIIVFYVYSAKDVDLDAEIRKAVDTVYYKPFEISVVSRRIDELLSV